MTQEQFDRLKAELQGNKGYIEIGFQFAKGMIIDNVMTEKRAVLESTFDFNKLGDNIINTLLQQQLQASPLEEEKQAAKGETDDPEEEARREAIMKKEEMRVKREEAEKSAEELPKPAIKK